MSERSLKMQKYRREYWQRYKEKNRRVYGTLSRAEYTKIADQARNNGRSIWAEIWAQVKAYREQSFLPSKDIAQQIQLLYVAQRRIGNNINQLAQSGNIMGKLRKGREINALLYELEQAIADFSARPWRIKDCEPGPGSKCDDN